MSRVYDFIVIGGGVVGCAMIRRLALDGACCALIEKAPDLLDGASKGNSAILHTGFDAPAGSSELEAIKRGNVLFHQVGAELGLAPPQYGALVLAKSENDVKKLESIRMKARENGIENVKILEKAAVIAREPHLNEQRVFGALHVPDEAIVDPWSLPLACAHTAKLNGAGIFRQEEVRSANFDGKLWEIFTQTQTFKTHHVINCAGLFSDRIDEMFVGKKRFEIKPRRGQFLVFDKEAAGLINHIILPVPTKDTKGIVIARTVFGNLLIGPTADEQESRETAIISPTQQEQLHKTALSILPALRNLDVTAHYSGIRPASNRDGYQVHFDRDLQYTCVGGIRSTGLSSALGLAEMVCARVVQVRETPEKIMSPSPPQLVEHGIRDYQMDGHGGIICHCEGVTKREIETALKAPIPPATFAGLKRATRVAMGRCQGFYCTGALEKLTRGKLEFPMTGGTKP